MHTLTTMKTHNISMLTASNNSIQNEGVKYILESKWENMEIIEIAKNCIDFSAWKYL